MNPNAREWYEVHFLNDVTNNMTVAGEFPTWKEAITWANNSFSEGKRFFIYRVKRQQYGDYIAPKGVK